MEKSKRSSIWFAVLKTITIILVIVLVLLLSVYFLFKESFGINIFTISSTLSKIQDVPEDMVSDDFNDEFIANTYLRIFNNSEIYSDNEDNFVFSMSNFSQSELSAESIDISAKELSEMLSVFPVTQNWFYGENQGKVREVKFLSVTGESVQISVLSELDFAYIKQNLNNGNLIEEYIRNKIPDKMYFTTYLTLTSGEEGFSATYTQVIVNRLSESDSNEILELASIIFGVSSREAFSEKLTQSFCELAFSSSSSFFSSFGESVRLTFVEVDGEIFLEATKVNMDG